jgi:hypothetical protein
MTGISNFDTGSDDVRTYHAPLVCNTLTTG